MNPKQIESLRVKLSVVKSKVNKREKAEAINALLLYLEACFDSISGSVAGAQDAPITVHI